jgi:acetyl xylan esterase (AXE1)
MKRLNLLALFVLVAVSFATAQPKQTLVTVAVSPDHSDWLYTCGEKPEFRVSVTTSHCPVAGAKIHYEISEDMLAPIKKGDMVLKDGTTVIGGYTMKKAGFLRCRVWATVDGRKYEECATAGFDIDRIEPKTVMPDDFVEFWEKALAANRKIDMLPELTLVPEKCTSKVNVYSASFQSFRKGSRIYGTLCVPAKIESKCPAILIVPGAGCRSRKGFYEEAENGFVTFEVGIHGIPTVLPDESLYTDLKNGSLIDYWFAGIDDKDNYFYKRVFLGCARAIDFLAELDFVDENHIGVTGGSQGGALTLTTAYLNPKVKCAAAFYPAMCDLTGYLHDQGNAWPYMFRNKKLATPERLETVKYYDVVNFARRLTVPVFFSFGYNDMVVCPTSVVGAYNSITSPKSRMVVPQSRHYTYPEQWKARSKWMMENVVK